VKILENGTERGKIQIRDNKVIFSFEDGEGRLLSECFDILLVSS
jgi:hypothetical protein